MNSLLTHKSSIEKTFWNEKKKKKIDCIYIKTYKDRIERIIEYTYYNSTVLLCRIWETFKLPSRTALLASNVVVWSGLSASKRKINFLLLRWIVSSKNKKYGFKRRIRGETIRFVPSVIS